MLQHSAALGIKNKKRVWLLDGEPAGTSPSGAAALAPRASKGASGAGSSAQRRWSHLGSPDAEREGTRERHLLPWPDSVGMRLSAQRRGLGGKGRTGRPKLPSLPGAGQLHSSLQESRASERAEEILSERGIWLPSSLPNVSCMSCPPAPRLLQLSITSARGEDSHALCSSTCLLFLPRCSPRLEAKQEPSQELSEPVLLASIS